MYLGYLTLRQFVLNGLVASQTGSSTFVEVVLSESIPAETIKGGYCTVYIVYCLLTYDLQTLTVDSRHLTVACRQGTE